MAAMLSVRNLVKRFGGLVAVNRVSLDVNAGEVLGLVGDNAAGKSTLIKCISGVYQADEGEISFQGQRAHFARPIDARQVGIERSSSLLPSDTDYKPTCGNSRCPTGPR